jgi:hypothetical protein
MSIINHRPIHWFALVTRCDGPLTLGVHRLRRWIRFLLLVRVGCIGDGGGRSCLRTDGGVHGASIGVGAIVRGCVGVLVFCATAEMSRMEADFENSCQSGVAESNGCFDAACGARLLWTSKRHDTVLFAILHHVVAPSRKDYLMRNGQ